MNLLLSQSFIEFNATVLFGFLVFATLIYIKQKWVNTMSYFITFLLLPATTYVITKVIANNLALSLGMIGALSIVRFRNPVKSPLELVMYFSLITIGISMGVNHFWSVVFEIMLILILLFSYYLEKILKKTNLRLFEYSFNSNDSLSVNILEIETDVPLTILDNNPHLIYFSKSDNINHYKLGIQNKDELKKTIDDLKDNKSIKNIEVQYSN